MQGWDDYARGVIVLILGGGRGSRLDPLTRRRSKPAVPIAGKYRLIDIPISNAINSHMERMYVLTQYNSVSLHRHIGRTYRFDAFSRGFVQILAAQQTMADTRWFQGTADAVRQNLHVVEQLEGDHVLILSGDHMYRMDYRTLVAEHVETGADVSIAVLPCSEEEIASFGAARVDEHGRIIEFREKPGTPEARDGMEVAPSLLARQGVASDRPYLASMGVYLFSKPALIKLLQNDFIDFGGEVIPGALDSHRVQAHFFQGYWRDIGTIRAFFEAHIDLVQENPEFDFYDPSWRLYTRPRYLPGSEIHNCTFERCILAEGAIVESSRLSQSIVGIRSSIHNATIERSLIMGVDSHYPQAPVDAPPVGIGPGTVIRNAIVDKNARIGRNVQIINAAGVQNADNEAWAIRDGIVAIPKNAIIPDGTVI